MVGQWVVPGGVAWRKGFGAQPGAATAQADSKPFVTSEANHPPSHILPTWPALPKMGPMPGSMTYYPNGLESNPPMGTWATLTPGRILAGMRQRPGAWLEGSSPRV
jgi:hypothetical protein